MKKSVALAIIFLELAALITPMIQVLSAILYKVGVKIGDKAKYEIVIAGWNTTDPNVPMPQSIKDAQNTEWIQINVTNLSYTTVTIQVTTQFKNKTNRINQNVGDIKAGSGNLSLQLIAADLDMGDRISEAPDSLTVNKTIGKRAANAQREVNYAFAEGYTPQGEDAGETVIYEFYWDRKSGIITGMSLLREFESSDLMTRSLMIMEISETNIWQPETVTGLSPEWVAIISIAVVLIVLIVLVASVISRKPKRRLKSHRVRMSGILLIHKLHIQ